MCLDYEESFTIRGLKVLCPSLFDVTVVHISVTIVNQVYERNELMSKAKLIIHLVIYKPCTLILYYVVSFISSFILWITDIEKQILVT